MATYTGICANHGGACDTLNTSYFVGNLDLNSDRNAIVDSRLSKTNFRDSDIDFFSFGVSKDLPVQVSVNGQDVVVNLYDQYGDLLPTDLTPGSQQLITPHLIPGQIYYAQVGLRPNVPWHQTSYSLRLHALKTTLFANDSTVQANSPTTALNLGAMKLRDSIGISGGLWARNSQDTDWFRITTSSTSVLSAKINAEMKSVPLDATVSFWKYVDGELTRIPEDENQTPKHTITRDPLPSGTYYVRVRQSLTEARRNEIEEGFQLKQTFSMPYRLTLECQVPQYTYTIGQTGVTGTALLSKDSEKLINISLSIYGNKLLVADRETWIIAHGRNDSSLSFFGLAGSIQNARPNAQILLIDWSEGAQSVLLEGANWTVQAGEWMVRVLEEIGISMQSVNVVGHSWGTYVAAFFAKASVRRSNGTVNVLVALDPATATSEVLQQPWSQEKGLGTLHFGEVSNYSISFRSSALGSKRLSKTADDAIEVGIPSSNPLFDHSQIVEVFRNIIKSGASAPFRGVFTLDNLLQRMRFRPWDRNGLQVDGSEAYFEAKLYIDVDKATPTNLTYTAKIQPMLSKNSDKRRAILSANGAELISQAGNNMEQAHRVAASSLVTGLIYKGWLGEGNTKDFFKLQIRKEDKSLDIFLDNAAGILYRLNPNGSLGKGVYIKGASRISVTAGAYFFVIKKPLLQNSNSTYDLSMSTSIQNNPAVSFLKRADKSDSTEDLFPEDDDFEDLGADDEFFGA
jgi:pimeloyl-ACP methyl ester carboxylesterase